MTLILGSLVLPEQVAPGWVLVRDGIFADLGFGQAPSSLTDDEIVDATDCLVLPGLVDIHCHGGGGHSFDLGIDSARAAAAFHAQAGSTSVMASLGTTTPARLLDQVEALGPLVAQGVVLGLHLEGPFLSAARRGGHPEELLRAPDRKEVAEVLQAALGRVSMVTIAPELDGALEVIEQCTGAGVTVALGHTDASAGQTRAGIDAGATVATHLFNGMRPIHHREGGPAVALMDDDRVSCELICDGHHVSAEVCSLAFRALGRDRLILITDACTAAGMPDGSYVLGTETIVLSGGEVRTADGRSLCGSALTLIEAVRLATSWGLPLVDAVRAASLNPARALGLVDRGSLSEGTRADIVITDQALGVRRVMRGGRWL